MEGFFEWGVGGMDQSFAVLELLAWFVRFVVNTVQALPQKTFESCYLA